LNICVFYFEAGFVSVSIFCIINYNLRSSSGNSQTNWETIQRQNMENYVWTMWVNAKQLCFLIHISLNCD